MTTKPWAAQKSTSGPYPLSDERKLAMPWPWDNRMTGRSLPDSGIETLISSGTGRSGTSKTTGQ
jgi:hypothetical protein